MIYMDNAAAAKTLRCALNAFQEAPYANPSSSHAMGIKAKEALEEARTVIAGCLGAFPDEVYFTSGATEACNWAMEILEFNCLSLRMHNYEHSAVYDCALTHGEEENKKHPIGFVQMLAHNETGEIFTMPADKASADLLFVDATAAAGHIPVHFHDLGADYLAVGGHKFGAPKGIGALLIRNGAPHSKLLYGGEQEKGLRAGTESVPLICAMSAALSWQTVNMSVNKIYLLSLRDYLIESLLKEVKGVHINAPWGKGFCTKQMPHIVNISFEGIEGPSLVNMLSQRDICVSAGSACTSGNYGPSRSLLALGVKKELAGGALRLSLSPENSYTECDMVIKAIKECVSYLRGEKEEKAKC